MTITADTELTIIDSGGQTTALAAGCECEAPDPDECTCPGATWFIRVDADETDEEEE